MAVKHEISDRFQILVNVCVLSLPAIHILCLFMTMYYVNFYFCVLHMYITYCICVCMWLCTTAQAPGSLFAEERGIDGVSFEACGRQAQGT